jgi:1-acyl-sn-glycerol-3-phosphate acyltransferase
VLIDPLWPLVAAALAVVLVGVGVVGAAAAPFGPRRRLLRFAVLGLIYLWLDVGLLVGCVYLWIRTPRELHESRAWTDAHCRLLTDALGRLERAATRWAHVEIVIESDDNEQPPTGPVIVLARHAGLGDSVALVYLILTRYRRRPRVVLKDVLQWDPGIDVILNRLSGCFLPSRTGAGEDLAERLADVASTMHSRDALLIFPEGGNWTPRRHRRIIQRLRRAGRRDAARRAEQMPRVLPPRPGGTLACIAARPDAHIVVVAHTGLDRLATPRETWRAFPPDGPMRVAWWCVPGPGPGEESGERWINEQWLAVDRWVGAHRHRTMSA